MKQLREALKQAWRTLVEGPPIDVCLTCVRVTDRQARAAGDFSVCWRCQESITSRTGVAVWPQRIRP
jgi:hypothetical protein